MSEVTIESVLKQLNEAQNNINLLIAQLEAHKGMLNQQLAENVQLRTNFYIAGKNIEERDKLIFSLRNEVKLKDELIKSLQTPIPPVEEVTQG
jgi:predicted RNase H-like nuclease (RuvC/YqgF family)